MNKFLKTIIKYFLVLAFLITCAKAQNNGAGNTGLSFLKLGITSRSIAMGEAVAGNTFDASATHYNPASLMNGERVNLVFMHNEQVLGIRTEFLAGKVKFSRIALGFSLNNTSVDNIQIREIPGESLGEFTAQNFAMGISLGYKINENISAGVTGKFLYEKIYVDNASGIGVDLGVFYSKGKLSLGAALSNLGSMNELRNEPTKLPSSIRFGGAYSVDILSISSRLIIAADGYKVMDGGKFHANTGAELTYKDFLSFRTGYQSGYENKSFTAGFGLKYKAFTLDYAFVPYKFSLGSSHTITLGTSF